MTHHQASDPSASSAAVRGDTVTVTQSGAAGQLTEQIKYRVLPTRKIKLLSVTYSGDTRKALAKNPVVVADFGPGLNPSKPHFSIGFVVILHPSLRHHFSGSMSAKVIRSVNKDGVLGRNGSVSITLESNDVVNWQPVPGKAGPPTGVKIVKKVMAVLTATAILS